MSEDEPDADMHPCQCCQSGPGLVESVAPAWVSCRHWAQLWDISGGEHTVSVTRDMRHGVRQWGLSDQREQREQCDAAWHAWHVWRVWQCDMVWCGAECGVDISIQDIPPVKMSSSERADQPRHKRHCSHRHRRDRERLREAARNRDVSGCHTITLLSYLLNR